MHTGYRSCTDWWRTALAGLALSFPAYCGATDDDRSALVPNAFYLQTASGEDTDKLSAGLQWRSLGRWQWGPGFRVTASLELELGRWRAALDADGSAWSWTSQISLVPIVRWSGPGETGWYGELGIGPSYLTPIYRSRDKRFSSRFQFRDHLGLGFRWGGRGKHDLSLRIEHFSNAGIERPNPGVNLIALRYMVRL